ncbi:UV-stimulated scaffold protein like [Actinidia chinensis var. chinensis]|uniref:UV-stimulated scaffold protein like n=1 Tax=Actinidia chinensis var. chinensis TaxID=1590841 RepID=A0A2R6R9K6_ACTCC|nr:UV-stimulated scaffold protein like [Actinidia chinensis var. chinensis]
MMMMEEERERVVVVGLIEKATNSTAAEVDPRLLKAIKSVVRHSDSELRLAAQTLMNLMKRDHSQVRYLALLIIDELFMRSKLFRTLVVENLDQLLTLSVGFRRNLPLPAPPSVASVLRSKAVELLEKWNVSYGLYYRQLRLGFDHLKNTLRFQFPNLQANAVRIQQERREREMRTREILVNKFETLKETFSSIKDELQSTIDEIGECLEIVIASDEPMPLGLLDDEEMEEFRCSELRRIRLDTLKEGNKVQETSDNKVVFDALRELYRLLVTKHLVSVQEWVSVLTRVEVADNRCRDSMLKELIDIRNNLKSVKKKCEESGCSLPDTRNNEEEDIWEEGTIESFENRSSVLNYQSDDSSIASTSVKVKNKPFENRNKEADVKEKLDCEDSGTDSDPLRSKLLAEAPLMKWGSFLDSWGSKRDYLANQRGLELEGHWGRIDYDAVIPAEKIAELNVQATLYKEDPVEIQPCHAPLSKGGLCQRRDLRVCPFHGPIVPRDDEGKPINQTSLTEELTPELETNLVDHLAKQAVKNVRDRDKEKAKKREHDKQALKRAKLAKVREHNDAVLRDAALASTSRSSAIGEDVETAGGERSSARSKKQTLASMLKKKVTSKDRLAQRLLNTRARDATERQLTQGEDAKYREAFPNQW